MVFTSQFALEVNGEEYRSRRMTHAAIQRQIAAARAAHSPVGRARFAPTIWAKALRLLRRRPAETGATTVDPPAMVLAASSCAADRGR